MNKSYKPVMRVDPRTIRTPQERLLAVIEVVYEQYQADIDVTLRTFLNAVCRHLVRTGMMALLRDGTVDPLSHEVVDHLLTFTGRTYGKKPVQIRPRSDSDR